MNTKTTSILLLIVGLALAAVSLFADSLGLGEGSGLGYKQIAGLAAGLGLALTGLLLLRRK